MQLKIPTKMNNFPCISTAIFDNDLNEVFRTRERKSRAEYVLTNNLNTKQALNNLFFLCLHNNEHV